MDRSLSFANRHPRLRIDRRAISRAIATLDQHAEKFRDGCPPGELSLVFLTDEALAQLHADFLDDPSITDVITFEGNPSLGVAGEICVSADAALRQVTGHSDARALPARLQAAFSAELTLYLVHGWLHLAGYDDLQPVKKRAMRRAESRAMRLLRQPGSSLPAFALRAPASSRRRRS